MSLRMDRFVRTEIIKEIENTSWDLIINSAAKETWMESRTTLWQPLRISIGYLVRDRLKDSFKGFIAFKWEIKV